MEKNNSKQHKIKKDDLFKSDQERILNECLQLLGICNGNTIFYIEDITDTVKNNILQKASDIKKFFPASTWSFFKYNRYDDWYILLKGLFKYMKIETAIIYMMAKESKTIKKHGLQFFL